jgi:hypothetical protein
MADNPEIARARRLLKSSQELLERSRNRPRVEVREWRPEPEKQALAPVVYKTIKQPKPSGTMDPETQKAWDDWARSIARAEAKLAGSAAVQATVDALAKWINAHTETIKELQGDIARLKGQRPPSLKAVGGRNA